MKNNNKKEVDRIAEISRKVINQRIKALSGKLGKKSKRKVTRKLIKGMNSFQKKRMKRKISKYKMSPDDALIKACEMLDKC